MSTSSDGAIGLGPDGKLNIVEPGSPRAAPRIIPNEPTWRDFVSPEEAAEIDAAETAEAEREDAEFMTAYQALAAAEPDGETSD